MKTKVKTGLLVLGTWFLAASLFAQRDPVDRLFEKYAETEGFTTVYISPKMFSLFSQVDQEDKDIQELMGGLKSIRILASDDAVKKNTDINFFKEVMKDLPKDKYEELMVVKNSDQNLKFLVREENGKVVELLMVGGGNGNNVLISIRGNIDMKNISRISKALNVEGLENLEKMDEKK